VLRSGLFKAAPQLEAAFRSFVEALQLACLTVEPPLQPSHSSWSVLVVQLPNVNDPRFSLCLNLVRRMLSRAFLYLQPALAKPGFHARSSVAPPGPVVLGCLGFDPKPGRVFADEKPDGGLVGLCSCFHPFAVARDVGLEKDSLGAPFSNCCERAPVMAATVKGRPRKSSGRTGGQLPSQERQNG
jgi:hypothetical protein